MKESAENQKDAYAYEIQPLREPRLVPTDQKRGEVWFQIVAILSASLAAYIGGFLYAWPSPFLLKITQDKENYNISETEASYFTITHPLGMMTLPIFLVPAAKLVGRKTTLLLSAVPYIASFVIKIFAHNVWLLYFARFCAGAGDSVVFASLPLYIGEVATPEVRGVWGNAFIIGLFLGQTSVNIVGSYCNVQQTSYIGLTIPVLFLILFSLMPESPYFLIVTGHDDKARQSLRKLRRKDDVEDEFAAIKLSVVNQMKETGSWTDLVTIKANRRALVAGLFLRLSQLLSGVYVFASYTQYIFAKAGGNISAQTSAIFYTSLTVVMYAASAYASNKVGRRKAYIISIFLSGIVVICEAIYFYIDIRHSEIDLNSIQWFPLAGMLIFVVFSSFGVGIIPSLMLGELFAASVKSKGACVLSTAFGAGIIITNNIFFYFNASTGLYGPFFLFGACNILFTFLAYYVVPETKGKTLEEIQETLRKM